MTARSFLETPEPKIVAYLLYGDRREYQRELAFSALSALHYLQDDARGVRLCVLTDQPELEFDFGLERHALSAEELSEWTLGGRCNHRAKPLALRKLLASEKLPVALVDTDTWFVDHPVRLFESISPGHSAMHTWEYALGDSALWTPLLARFAGRNSDMGPRISTESPMFNSGVIAMHPSDRALLDQAVALLDELMVLEPIFNVEQFAIGAVLNQHTQLTTTEHVVRHYWGFERAFIHVQIARFLQGFRPERAHELARRVPGAVVGQPPRRLAHRLASRLMAQLNGWDNHCRFGYLAYLSALTYAHRDSAYANVWIDTALNALAESRQRASTAARHITRLRRAFRGLDVRRAAWLEPQLAHRWLQFWGVQAGT